MCEKAVKDEPYSLKYVPDWFVTREWVDMWRDEYYDMMVIMVDMTGVKNF